MAEEAATELQAMKGKQRERRHGSVDTIVTEMTSNSKVSLKQASIV